MVKHHKYFLYTIFTGLLLFSQCSQNLTYQLEVMKSPVNLVAVNRAAGGGFTELTFYAYNIESDFNGYKISTGNSEANALAATTNDCLFSVNSNVNKPTKIQLGGTKQSGYDCYLSTVSGVTPPLVAGTDWVAVKSYGSRDCSNGRYGSDCSPYSDTVTIKVSAEAAAPTAPGIQYYSVGNYYIITVTTNTNELGLFYSSNADEADYRVLSYTTLYDGYCNFGGVGTKTIQIGGTNTGANCYLNNIYLNTGDTIALRGLDPAKLFPWSDFVSMTVP